MISPMRNVVSDTKRPSLTLWYGYPQYNAARDRPWWTLCVHREGDSRLVIPRWVRTDGRWVEAWDLGEDAAAMAQVDSDDPLPPPPPMPGQVWFRDGQHDLVLRVDHVDSVFVNPETDAPVTMKRVIVVFARGEYEAFAGTWPPLNAALVFGPYAPWAAVTP